MIKKMFVYDTSKGFSSFIKYYYSEKMEIHICTNKIKFQNFIMSDYEVCFFIVNDIDDFLKLRIIYSQIEYFFISTPKKALYKKIEHLNYDDAIIIDFDYSKKDILSEINFNLNLKKII